MDRQRKRGSCKIIGCELYIYQVDFKMKEFKA